jgi:hypothetical protein
MGIRITKTLELVDTTTGEVVNAIAYVPEARDKGFVKLYKLLSSKLLEDLGSLNGEARLLLWFIAKTLELPVQSDMWIPITFEEVAKDLKVSTRTIRSYIKRLLKLGYIEQYRKKHLTFRVKPDFLYKGSLVKYKEACLEEDLRRMRKQ